MIYLDNNATTRPASEVIAAVAKMLEADWANPSSVHGWGQAAARAVSMAREEVASLINASPDQVVFTSGATEANDGILRHHAARGADLITSAAEHPAVTGFFLRNIPARVHLIPVDSMGRWRIEVLESVLDGMASPSLVALAWSNGETGVLQDVSEISTLAHTHGATCLIDASQAVGRHEIDVSALNTAYLTFSGHKFHGPKGIGVLVQPRSGQPTGLAVGGGQENGRRGGTENVPGIVGMGAACKLRRNNFEKSLVHLVKLRDSFEAMILNASLGAKINGANVDRVPNTSNMTFPGIDGIALVARLEARGILCSQVSACSSGNPEPSRTLLAMGRSREEAFASVRFAVSVDNTTEEIDAAAQGVVEEVRFLREMMGGLV